MEAIQVSPLFLCCSFPATTNVSVLVSVLTMFTPFYFYTCHSCIIPTNVSFLISVLTMFTPFYFYTCHSCIIPTNVSFLISVLTMFTHFYFYFLKHKENIFFSFLLSRMFTSIQLLTTCVVLRQQGKVENILCDSYS